MNEWNTFIADSKVHRLTLKKERSNIIIYTLSNDVWQNWNRLLDECRKPDHSIAVAAISQWRRRLSACVRAQGGHFEHILCCFYVILMLKIFEFVFLLFDCFVCRQSVTCLKSYQVWALHRWGGTGRHNHKRTADSQLSPKSLCQKLERLVAVWWRYAKKIVGLVFFVDTLYMMYNI